MEGHLGFAVDLTKRTTAHLIHLNMAYCKHLEEVALSRNAAKAMLKLDQKHLDSSHMAIERMANLAETAGWETFFVACVAETRTVDFASKVSELVAGERMASGA